MYGSRRVHPKVAAGSTAGAFSIILVYALGELGVRVPAEVASSFTVVLSASAAYAKRAI